MRSLIDGIRGAATRTGQPPVPFTSRRSGGFSVSDLLRGNSRTDQLAAMGTVGTLFAIVHRTSNSTSQVGWKLWRKAASGKDEDRVEVTRHAALDVWNRPNQFFTQQEFIESVQQHVDLTGEGWWVIARNPLAPVPLELWPVRPDRIAPVPHPDRFLAGYVYTSPDGEKVPLQLDEVIQLRMPNPEDPYRGMGPVQAMLTDLDSARYSAEWNRNFFRNSAEPGGVIEVDKRLSDPEWDEMTARWREQHQGVANAHRVAILEQGKWVDRKFTMRDMQFAELRTVSREVIREAFGVHGHILGLSDSVNRANAEAAEVTFARWLVKPRLERIKQALNNDFLPMFGATTAGLEFDYDNPVPDDRAADDSERTSKAQAAELLVRAGFAPADVCAAVGLPEMEHVAPPEPAGPVLPPAATVPPAGPPAARRPRAAATEHDTGGQGGGDQTQPPPIDEDEKPDLTAVQQAWEDALDALLTRWTGVQAAQVRALAEQIRAAVEHGDVAALSRLSAPDGEAAGELERAMVDLAAAAAHRMATEAADQGVTVDAVVPAHESLQGLAAAVAAFMATELATSAGREALRLWGPGWTAEQVAEQVTAHLEALTDAQPRLYLGGALTGAQNAGRVATLHAGPLAAYYGDERMDSNTCGPCRDVNGKWLGDLPHAEEQYPHGGFWACEGRWRCRGTIVAVWRGGDDPSKWIEKEPLP